MKLAISKLMEHTNNKKLLVYYSTINPLFCSKNSFIYSYLKNKNECTIRLKKGRKRCIIRTTLPLDFFTIRKIKKISNKFYKNS